MISATAIESPEASHAAQGDPASEVCCFSSHETAASGDSMAGNVPLHPVAPPLTESQLRERNRRLALVQAVENLITRKVSLRSAAALLGEPVANLSRYRSEYAAGGLEALTPRVSPGRRPKFALTVEEGRALKALRLKKGSFALAIEWFTRDTACRPETRALIAAELDRAATLRREPAWPDSLRRAGQVTVDEEALFRGAKHFGDIEFVERRGLEWIDESGQRLPLGPNTIWESDDMSSNEPFSWIEAGHNGAKSHRIGRQTLCTIDVFSCHWLGVSPIGRERDAYRVEDIADHMLDCVQAHGLPRIWRLERGPWENNFIDGVPLRGVLAPRQPAAGAAEGVEPAAGRWGGLDPLIRIIRAWKSRQKGTVEGGFNLLQDLLAHASTSIGRSRGEFEAQTKLFLAAGRGDLEAWARFWPIGECADGFARAMAEFNHRPKKRRAFGRDLVVPADLYRDFAKIELRAEDAWRFCPQKREATVRGGHVECTVDHYPLPFRFRVNGNESGLYLGHGYRVLIAFHPGYPERGCHVFNAETGTTNRDGFKFGEKLLLAPMAEDAPQVDLSPAERQLHARKNANAAVRAEFREVRAMGSPAIRSSTARDGFGGSATLSNRSSTGFAASVGAVGTEREGAPVRSHNRAERPFDESAELARLERMEAEAIARGDLQPL